MNVLDQQDYISCLSKARLFYLELFETVVVFEGTDPELGHKNNLRMHIPKKVANLKYSVLLEYKHLT